MLIVFDLLHATTILKVTVNCALKLKFTQIISKKYFGAKRQLKSPGQLFLQYP